MSVKKAQKIVNEIGDRLGMNLVAFHNTEIEWLKGQLEDFLELEIDTDELADPEDVESEDYSFLTDDSEEDNDSKSDESDESEANY